MYTQKISVASIRNFNLRGVMGPDQTINGLIRLTGTKGRNKVSGICAFFQVNTQSGQLYIDDQNLLFCGNERDLARNYNQNRSNHRSSPFSPEQLAGYFDHPYSMHTRPVDKSFGSKGFYQIPVTDMRLGSSQQIMVEELMEQVKANMPEWIKGLVLEQVNQTDINKRKAFGVLFSVFPKDLKDAALAANYFYRNHEVQTEIHTELLHLPTLKLIFTPMGGLPSWAKAGRRRI